MHDAGVIPQNHHWMAAMIHLTVCVWVHLQSLCHWVYLNWGNFSLLIWWESFKDLFSICSPAKNLQGRLFNTDSTCSFHSIGWNHGCFVLCWGLNLINRTVIHWSQFIVSPPEAVWGDSLFQTKSTWAGVIQLRKNRRKLRLINANSSRINIRHKLKVGGGI